MLKERKNLLVLFCGGTVLMEAVQDGVLGVAARESTLHSLRNLEPMLRSIADIELEYVVNVDSSNVQPPVWEDISTRIHQRYRDFDGFIVIHGTDTLAYTSVALSYILQGLGKPVVLTGAQIPATFVETDARRNLINSVRIATMDLSGVYVVFNEYLIRGCRASKVSESRLSAFASVNEAPAGEIGVGIRLRHDLPTRHEGVPALLTGFKGRVLVSTLYPGLDPSIFEKLLDGAVDAFVIRAFGTGNIPDTLVPFLEKARLASIPVVLSTQCREGRTDLGSYEAGRIAVDQGVIPSQDMSLEATVVKLMWLLGMGTGFEELPSRMAQDLVGEIRSG